MSENNETIMVGSIVSHRTHKGVVQIEWNEKSAQLDIPSARQLAHNILECCESALTDEIIIGFCEYMNDLEAGVALMQYFRDARDKRQKESE